MTNRTHFVLDGGMATELDSNAWIAAKFDDPEKHINEDLANLQNTPLWSSVLLIDEPQAVVAAHERFLHAGSDIIQTNTYQASYEAFSKVGIDKDDARNYLKSAVDFAKTAIKNYRLSTKSDREILIAGSIGPFGVTRADASEYSGIYMKDTDKQVIMDYHKRQASTLLEAGCDLLRWDTIPSLHEAECILNVLRQMTHTSRVPPKAWISFSCNSVSTTCAGDLFSDCYKICDAAKYEGFLGVGINCTNPKYVSSLIQSVGKTPAAGSPPFIVYPNSGEAFDKNIGWHYEEGSPQTTNWQELITDWSKLGVRYFGGCCRVTSNHVQIISDLVHKLPV